MQDTPKPKNPLLSLWDNVIDTLLPPRCLATGEVVDAPGMLSPAYWQQLKFIEDPFCHTCGIPFAYNMGATSICVACMERPPTFDQARSAVVYNDASKNLILAFKYGDRLHAVHTFVPWMLRSGAVQIEQADMIIPVPLHQRRLRERRFNQSALLAQEIAKRRDKAYVPDALLRERPTVPQKGLTRSERNKNVHGAFSVTKNIRSKHVLLIDDVYTTGATLNECARVLLKAHVASINVLTIARVTQDEF